VRVCVCVCVCVCVLVRVRTYWLVCVFWFNVCTYAGGMSKAAVKRRIKARVLHTEEHVLQCASYSTTKPSGKRSVCVCVCVCREAAE
jgi:hypothetical protein